MPPDTRLRIKVVGGGCSGFSYDLAFDEKQVEIYPKDGPPETEILPATKDDPVGPMDAVVEAHGVTMIIDQMSLMYIRGTEIDYVDELQGAGFKFNNPNVQSTCGCGSSFAV